MRADTETTGSSLPAVDDYEYICRAFPPVYMHHGSHFSDGV
jgi:hypothetical protein